MELGQKMAGPLDGAGEDAGKETDKQGVIEKILFGAKLFLINMPICRSIFLRDELTKFASI